MLKRLLVFLPLLVLAGCPTDVASALRMYGYAPVRPASTLWQPGTMVYIRNRDPYEVGVVCTAKQMLGESFVPLRSLTNNAELQKASKRGITMAANVREIVTSDAELQAIKSVKMVLRNVSIAELSDQHIEAGSQHTQPECIRAIMRRRRQGFEVTMISAALQADVSYVVSWEKTSKLDVEAKVAAVQNLSAKLGVEAQQSSDKAIEAKGLVWGIRDDAFLAYLFDPAHCPQVRPHSQLFDPALIDNLTVSAEGRGLGPLPSAGTATPPTLPTTPEQGAEGEGQEDYLDGADASSGGTDATAPATDVGAAAKDGGAPIDQVDDQSSTDGMGGTPSAGGADAEEAVRATAEGRRSDVTDAKRSVRPSSQRAKSHRNSWVY